MGYAIAFWVPSHRLYSALRAVKLRLPKTAKSETIEGDPIDELRNLHSRFRPVAEPGLPRFHGGAVGYFSYDIVRFVEDIPELGVDELKLWDSLFMITDTVLVFDNINHKIKIIYNAHVEDPEELKRLLRERCKENRRDT